MAKWWNFVYGCCTSYSFIDLKSLPVIFLFWQPNPVLRREKFTLFSDSFCLFSFGFFFLRMEGWFLKWIKLKVVDENFFPRIIDTAFFLNVEYFTISYVRRNMTSVFVENWNFFPSLTYTYILCLMAASELWWENVLRVSAVQGLRWRSSGKYSVCRCIFHKDNWFIQRSYFANEFEASLRRDVCLRGSIRKFTVSLCREIVLSKRPLVLQRIYAPIMQLFSHELQRSLTFKELTVPVMWQLGNLFCINVENIAYMN